MKKQGVSFLLPAVLLGAFSVLFASNFVHAEDGLRAVWVSTVGNIDFPSKPGIPVEQMKKEADTFLDTVEDLGFKAVFFQTRPMGDAMYPSKIYPWSGHLTGKQGKAPEENFDPLKYWVDGAHKRGLQLHAWCNPYRVTTGGRHTLETLDPNNPAVLHPEWTFQKGGKVYLNPGIPEVRELVISGLVEIVSNYEVDGVHFDDYFYPEGIKDEDAETFKKYGAGFEKIEDWRRNNIDLLIQEIQKAVKKANPKTAWGISPAGIWANKPGHPEGSATRGNSTYFNQFADTRKWVKEEWIDYIVPQIYWHIGFEIADFKTLVDWWSEVVDGTNVKLYIGMAAYRVDPQSKTEQWKSPEELVRQLDYLKTKKQVAGFVMFTMHDLKKGTAVSSTLSDYFNAKDSPKPRSTGSSKVNKKAYIYLSPSSQNRNIGFGEYLSEEYRMNQLARQMVKHLKESGITVLPEFPPITKELLDSEEYDRPSLRSRLDESMRIAKELEKTEPGAPFYHIALHTNASGSGSGRKARGVETFVDPSNPQSVAIGECILRAAVAQYYKDNPDQAERYADNPKYLEFSRGVKDTGRLIEAQGVNTKNGTLIELGFHDEENDSKWMLRCIAEGEKEGGVNPLAKAMCDAIVEFINAQ